MKNEHIEQLRKEMAEKFEAGLRADEAKKPADLGGESRGAVCGGAEEDALAGLAWFTMPGGANHKGSKSRPYDSAGSVSPTRLSE
jgi:hypothetical protein